MNNFDKSSSGIDIVLNIFFDNLRSSYIFETNFKPLAEESNFHYLYVMDENLSDSVDYSILPNQKDKILEAFETNIEDMSYFVDLSQEDIIAELFPIETPCEISFILNKYGIKTARAEKYITIQLIGYSQGDMAWILVNSKEFEEVAGIPFDINTEKKYLQSIFYDSVLTANVSINNVDYDLTIDGSYGEIYDKQDIINDIVEQVEKSQPDIDIKTLTIELNKLVPEDISDLKYC